jgi:aminopeptidase N
MNSDQYRLRRILVLAALFAICSHALVACKPADTPPMEPITYESPAGRLPNDVRPLAYRLDLLLDPREDNFSGEIEIDVQLDHPATGIWLHGENLEVTGISTITADNLELAAEYTESQNMGVARVNFASELPAGLFTLRIQYGADYNRNLAGLFKVEEQGEVYVLAKSESIQARKYLPGFDEPGLKATFDLKLTIPAGYVAIANSREIERRSTNDGMETVTFATTRPMSTYLLSLAVGPFDMVERDAIPPNQYREQPIPLRGFSRKARGQDMAYILDITPRMVEIFEQELQRPYPFDKLDIIAAPQWPSGATELSAAITYREQAILVGDNPAPGARLRLVGIHAHELSHMWFGNLVTPPWWDDLWLKEGFATWSTPVVLSILEPDGGHDLNAASSAIGAMKLDSLASTRAIREPITDNSEIRNAYDSITYSKSLGVIHMVDHYFSAERFRPALGRYIETFADGVADSPEFYRIIGVETQTPALTETFRSFVEQKGVPQLDFVPHCDDDSQLSMTIQQTRYKPLGSPIASIEQQWNIPICLRTDTGSPHCLMLTEAKQTVNLPGTACPTWILPNARGSGYYRWNLPELEWRALVQNFADLTPVEALSVIDSAFAAFEAGGLPEDILLQIVRQSSMAQQRQIVVAPLEYLRKYSRNYLASTDQPTFLLFSQALYQPVLNRIATSATSDEQLLRSELLSFMASTAKDPAARGQLLEMAHAFTGFEREQDSQALNSDLYTSALTVAIQDSDEEFLPHLLKFREELDDPLFENASANAIGSIINADQLGLVHDVALGDQLGPREVFGLLAHAIAEPELRKQQWQWLQDNFAVVIARIPEQWRRFTPALGSSFCSKKRLKELQQLFASHGDLVPGHKRRLAQTEEQIQLCMALRERGEALTRTLSSL